MRSVLKASAVLYAKWQVNSFKITYNANGGTGAPEKQIKKYGTNIRLSSVKPVRDGYTFNGWTSAGVTYQPGELYTVDSSIALYASWKLNTYRVVFDSNGGKGSPAAQTKKHGTDLVLSKTVPVKAGFTFLGWSSDAQAELPEYLPGDRYKTESKVTLYAVWIDNSQLGAMTAAEYLAQFQIPEAK